MAWSDKQRSLHATERHLLERLIDKIYSYLSGRNLTVKGKKRKTYLYTVKIYSSELTKNALICIP